MNPRIHFLALALVLLTSTLTVQPAQTMLISPTEAAVQNLPRPEAPAGTGDLLHTTTFQPCGGSPGPALAFDGQYMWYTCFNIIYKADALSGSVFTSFTPDVLGLLQSLAWDTKRQALLAMTYYWTDPGAVDNVYRIDPTTGSATLVFSLPAVYHTNTLAYDPQDDTLYMGSGGGEAVHFSMSGAILGSWPLESNALGLAVAGNLLYATHSTVGGLRFVAYDKASGAYQFHFYGIDSWSMNLECDSVTFAPRTALWAVTWTENSRPLARAYEIPSESCLPSWTLMFYLDGDNNLASTYPAIIQQLQHAAANPHVNIVALWDSGGSGNSAYYKFKTSGMDVTPQGELDMSNPATLVNFVNWARSKFPAQHYALLLDNHGSGVSGGLVDDTTSLSAIMSVPQMGTALNTITNNGVDKIDVLVMNMCLMAMIEDAYEVRNYSDYYVASENLQWAYSSGYYTYVSGITSTTTPAQFATMVVDGYANDVSSRSYTMSAGDISQLGNLVNATNSLAQLLTSQITTMAPILTNVRQAVQRYDNKSPHGTIDTADQYIDLYDFAEQVKAGVGDVGIQNAAQGVMDAVTAYIIAERHNSRMFGWFGDYDLDGSHGVSIFFPSTSSSFYTGLNLSFAAGTTWDGFLLQGVSEATNAWGPMLVSYFEAAQPGGADDPNLPEPVAKLVEYRLYLAIVVR